MGPPPPLPLQFFKVFQPHQSSESLMIPPAFEDKIRGKIQNRVILKNGVGKNRKIWLVDVKAAKFQEGLCFEGRWSKFVSDNRLEPGDFLVFKYLGQRIFHVLILAKNGCHKELVAAEELHQSLADE